MGNPRPLGNSRASARALGLDERELVKRHWLLAGLLRGGGKPSPRLPKKNRLRRGMMATVTRTVANASTTPCVSATYRLSSQAPSLTPVVMDRLGAPILVQSEIPMRSGSSLDHDPRRGLGDGYLLLRELARYSGWSVRTLRNDLVHASSPLPHHRIGPKVLTRQSKFGTRADLLSGEQSTRIC